MKSLLALLVLGLALGVGYWKTQHPDATVDDLTAGASDGINRFKGGLAAVADGGASQKALNTRIESLEAELVATQRAAEQAASQTETDQRLNSLESAIVATQEAADPSVINGRLQDAERRMSASESTLKEVQTTLTATADTFSKNTAAVSDQVTAIDSQLELLNRRIEEQSQQFNTDSINSALTNLDSQIATLQDEQRRSNDSQLVALTSMEEKINSFEARLNTLSADASNGQDEAAATINAQIDQRIATLENKLDTTTSDSLRIGSMTNELSASRVKMQSLEKNVADTNAQLAELTRSIEILKTKSESSLIDGQQAQLRSQLERLQAQMNQSSGDNSEVEELTNALQATRDRIQTLEQRVVDLPASSTEASDATLAQNALEAQIRALENKLANVQAAPNPNLINSISQVEEKVSELAAKGFVTQEELREQQQAKSTEYKIYFERNSTAITEAAGKVLNSFIAQEKNRTTGVSIYGFTDRRGSASYNQQLALQRATNVRSYLIQNGFSYTKIKSLSGLGEDAAAAQLPDGEEDAQQRAVVLYAQQP